MERLENIKESLISMVQGQMSHLESVETKELGEVIDMIKDLAEAAYYCTITEAMSEKYDTKRHYYEREPMDTRDWGTMYYPGSYETGSKMKMYSERDYPMVMRDHREGNSHFSRKMYMESKEMHEPKASQMKELEKYLHELSSDIMEMIQDASPEEKQVLKEKLGGLSAKIV